MSSDTEKKKQVAKATLQGFTATTPRSPTSVASSWLGGSTPRMIRRTTEDIFGIGISVKKEERKDLKKNDKKTFYKVRENCVKGIVNKFTQLKSINENSPVDHFESMHSVVTRFDDLQESLRVNDMLDVFKIASDYHTDGSGPKSSATSIDLFHNIRDTDMNLVKLANQYFMEYGQDYHGENVVWSGEKILNSCDETLRDKLIESTRGWDSKYKGGPTYLKILMGLIVATSEKSLHSLLDKVAKLKLSDFDGEDVNKVVSFLCGATLILRDNKSLPADFASLVLKIFKQTSCADFHSFVGLLEHNLELKLTNLTAEEQLHLFETKYTEMVGRNEWTPKSLTKDQESSFSFAERKLLCYNCGGIGHGIPQCKLPLDQEAINMQKGIITGQRSSDNNTSKFGNKNKSSNTNPKNGSPKGGPPKFKKSNNGKPSSDKPRDPFKKPPAKGESHQKKIDGKQLFWCGKEGCCCWGDHKTSDHPTNGNANHLGSKLGVGDDDNADDTDSHSASYLTASSFLGF